MYNPLEVVFSFPRLYLTLYLFGREFGLSVGWFRADTHRDWKFGPELTLLEKLSGLPLTAYSSSIGFYAFEHKLLLELDTAKYA